LPITDRPLLFTPKNEGELHRRGRSAKIPRPESYPTFKNRLEPP
jgi:hypothetical protein